MTSAVPLDELYLDWLHNQVKSKLKGVPSYWKLLNLMYTKEFLWFIPNDDNRAEDGKSLRLEFVDDQRLVDVDPVWMDMACSFLEMLVALSRRLSFDAEGEPSFWFWRLVDNLGLSDSHDKNRRFNPETIEQILDRVIWRKYEPNGVGGLFPLKKPAKDQRKVELWYQLSAYVLERV